MVYDTIRLTCKANGNLLIRTAKSVCTTGNISKLDEAFDDNKDFYAYE